MRRRHRTIALDIECTAKPRFKPWHDGAYIVSVGIVDESGFCKTWTFNHDHIKEAIDQRMLVKEIQNEIDKSYRIVGHNLKFDLGWLKSIGVTYTDQRLFCTQVADYLIEGQMKIGYTLNDVCKRRDVPIKKDMVKTYWDAGYETSEIPLRILVPYLEQDCISTLSAYQRQVPLLKRKGLERLNAIQCECLRVLTEIEYNGMLVNKQVGLDYSKEYRDQIHSIDMELRSLFGWDVNFNSGQHLSVALFGGTLKHDGVEPVVRILKSGKEKHSTRKCKIERHYKGAGFAPVGGSELKTEGFYSTDKIILKQLGGKTKPQKRIKELLLKRSGTKKVLETFVGKNGDKGLINKIMTDGYIHSSYNQTVTRTGRLSSSDPNGQNLPRKGTSPIKKIFIPRYDYLVAPDLGQAEWRGAGFLSQDPVILQEIRDDIDAHYDNAVTFFGHKDYRQDAKIFTFRMIYGGSAYGFFKDPKMPNFSLSKWKRIVEQFYEKYSRLKEWQDENIEIVNRQGYLVSPTGRILKFDKHPENGFNERQIKNYPVQSLATADIMPLAMVHIYRKVCEQRLKALAMGQVHDSIIFDTPRNEVDIVSNISMDVFTDLPRLIELTWGFKFNVPMTGAVEISKVSYGDMIECVPLTEQMKGKYIEIYENEFKI